MSVNYETLGRNLYYYRKKKKLTQEELAEQIDLSVGFISQLERGITKPSLDTLSEICDFLECHIGKILEYSDSECSPLLLESLELFQSLPKREQYLFFYMLQAYKEHI